MKQLIERLEKATVADRALEAAIARAVDEEMPDDPVGWPPRYMESIDAALTLVPEGLILIVGWDVNGGGEVELYGPTTRESVEAATPAIALCIAALKARDSHSRTHPTHPPETHHEGC